MSVIMHSALFFCFRESAHIRLGVGWVFVRLSFALISISLLMSMPVDLSPSIVASFSIPPAPQNGSRMFFFGFARFIMARASLGSIPVGWGAGRLWDFRL